MHKYKKRFLKKQQCYWGKSLTTWKKKLNLQTLSLTIEHDKVGFSNENFLKHQGKANINDNFIKTHITKKSKPNS